MSRDDENDTLLHTTKHPARLIRVQGAILREGNIWFSQKDLLNASALPSRSDVEVTSEDDFGLLEELFSQTLDHVDDKKKGLAAAAAAAQSRERLAWAMDHRQWQYAIKPSR